MRKALDALAQKCEGISQGQMLFDVVDYQLPTLSAITIQFARLPKMLGLIRRFSKAAVLTDKTWIKTKSFWKP
ncbi:MAG: STAS/SEC14 domain-containing protein [Gammaproteobacteria bacterium]|nr:STAS/SEC14 domain-containing protein [Gammaproteobacteria bacterium]